MNNFRCELLEGVVNNRWGGKSKQFTKVFSVNIFHYMYTVLVLLKPQAPASMYIVITTNLSCPTTGPLVLRPPEHYTYETSGKHTVCKAGATGPVGPVLAEPIFVRKRGRNMLCNKWLNAGMLPLTFDPKHFYILVRIK